MIGSRCTKPVSVFWTMRMVSKALELLEYQIGGKLHERRENQAAPGRVEYLDPQSHELTRGWSAAI